MASSSVELTNVTDLRTKLREILGEDLPIASFAFRRPSTAEESKAWDAEGVVINPSSLDVVIDETKRPGSADTEASQVSLPSRRR